MKIKAYFILLVFHVAKIVQTSTTNNDLSKLIVAKLVKFGYLVDSLQTNTNEIINAIKIYAKFNHLNGLNDDQTVISDSKASLLNEIYKTFQNSTKFIVDSLLNDQLKRCSLPDLIRDTNNQLNFKLDLLNGNAYYYLNKLQTANYYKSIEFLKQLKLKERKISLLSSNNVKESFKYEFIKYQIISWWPKTTLIWSFINKPLDFTYSNTLNSLKKAFESWSMHSNLEFIFIDYYNNLYNHKKKDIDLLIQFDTSENHDLYCKFKFANSTLAHAFYPTKGVAHFELGKSWSIQQYSATPTVIDFENVQDTRFNLINVGML